MPPGGRGRRIRQRNVVKRRTSAFGVTSLMEGVASPEDIDKALKLAFGFPMGPFELGDLVGLDVRLSVLQYLHKTLGERFRPCPLLVQYVEAGYLGRKTGRGMYEYQIAQEA